MLGNELMCRYVEKIPPLASLNGQLMRCKAFLFQKNAALPEALQQVRRELIQLLHSLSLQPSSQRPGIYRLVSDYGDILLAQHILSPTLPSSEYTSLLASWRQNLPSSIDSPCEWDKTMGWRIAVYAQVDMEAKQEIRIRGDGEWHAIRLAKEFKERDMSTQCYEILNTILHKKHVLMSSVAEGFNLCVSTLEESVAEEVASGLCSESLLTKEQRSNVLKVIGQRLSSSVLSQNTAYQCEGIILNSLNENTQNSDAWRIYASFLTRQPNRSPSEIVHALLCSLQGGKKMDFSTVCQLLQVVNELQSDDERKCLQDVARCPAATFLPFITVLFSPEKTTKNHKPFLDLLQAVYPEESWYYLYLMQRLNSPGLAQSLPLFHPLQGRYPQQNVSMEMGCDCSGMFMELQTNHLYGL